MAALPENFSAWVRYVDVRLEEGQSFGSYVETHLEGVSAQWFGCVVPSGTECVTWSGCMVVGLQSRLAKAEWETVLKLGLDAECIETMDILTVEQSDFDWREMREAEVARLGGTPGCEVFGETPRVSFCAQLRVRGFVEPDKWVLQPFCRVLHS
jgi:hypothetical protein